MLRGFKDFVLRGNVVDLAVAVVIGAAFTGVVTAVVDGVINPLVASVGGGGPAGLQIGLPGEAAIDVSLVLGAIINLLIVAAVVYFAVVVPVNKLLEMRRRGEVEEVAATPEDVALLQEIRDLLKARGGQA